MMQPAVEPRSSDLERTNTSRSAFDYLVFIWRRRGLILSFLIFSILTASGVTVVMPKAYESTATLLAPREGPSGNGGFVGGLVASGLLQQIPGLSLSSLAPNRDMLVSILRSRSLAQAVVERFSLRERYRLRYVEDAVKKLDKMVKVAISREGVISVRVEDTEPQVAAQVANFYVEQLDRFVAKYSTGDAGRQRGFLTAQLAQARADLDATEDALRHFQERNRAVALQDQTRGAIEAAARLKGEMMAAEVQLQVMRSFATEANPEVLALKRRIDEMTRQLARMQYGDGELVTLLGPQRQDQRDFSVPLPRVPGVGLELARLTREVKVQETLVVLLAQQLEQAKIAEAKDLPVVQLLDLAIPAERPSRPNLVFNLAAGAVGGLLAGAFTALVLESRNRSPMRARSA